VSRAKQDLRLWGHDVLVNVFRGCKRLRAGLLSEDPALLARISHESFGIGRAESVKVVVRTIASADVGDPADGNRL